MSLKDLTDLPQWQVPKGKTTELLMYNSLTRNKVPFTITRDDGRIGWYICGPTVYDAAHMGHARSYITFDVLRRLLENYFGWPVIYVMNITDIDDKIILRARQNHLFDIFLNENNISKDTNLVTSQQAGKIMTTLVESFVAYAKKQLACDFTCDIPENIPTFFKNITAFADSDSKYSFAFENISRIYHSGLLPALNLLSHKSSSIEKNMKDLSINDKSLFHFLSQCSDCIAPYLDNLKGAEVTDQRIFKQLAEYWENSFMEDMKTLNVQPPTTLTRATEYLPQIINYVQTIISRGYGYVSNGSVYFDTQAFIQSQHIYAKLEPSSAGNMTLLNEGEGSLFMSQNNNNNNEEEEQEEPSVNGNSTTPFKKKHPNDFALWKKSKKGEPRWQSPWGEGRPGWHIECSAMAGDVLGHQLDIHSGGIDLRFPHHDNEIAQSEAFHDCEQWVNYFLHAGHLHIEGQKMSKSLKNFITIEAALEKYTWRQIRIMFLLHSWKDTLDYKVTTMEEAIQAEGWLYDFFASLLAVGVVDRLASGPFSYAFFSSHAKNLSVAKEDSLATQELLKMYTSTMEAIHKSICDSFDTPTALKFLFELCKATKAFISRAASLTSSLPLLNAIGNYVTWFLSTTGLIDLSHSRHIGFPEQVSRDRMFRPCLNVIGGFRDDIRTLVRSALAAEDKLKRDEFLKLILSRCDRLRDEDMAKIGFEIEDRSDETMSSLVKVGDQRMLLEKLDAKNRAAKEKDERKRLLQAKLDEKEKEKRERAQIHPSKMFLGMNEFKSFDDTGFPTSDAQGEALSKNRIKKLLQERESQQKLYDEYHQ